MLPRHVTVRLEVLPCRINNLTMDSSAEYGLVRPSPLGPLGVAGAQQAALEATFGTVPPVYVSEAEALLDSGIETMEVRRHLLRMKWPVMCTKHLDLYTFLIYNENMIRRLVRLRSTRIMSQARSVPDFITIRFWPHPRCEGDMGSTYLYI